MPGGRFLRAVLEGGGKEERKREREVSKTLIATTGSDQANTGSALCY